jgi:hypothetical protein
MIVKKKTKATTAKFNQDLLPNHFIAPNCKDEFSKEDQKIHKVKKRPDQKSGNH